MSFLFYVQFLEFACDADLIYSRHELILSDKQTSYIEETERYSAIELAIKLGHTEIVELLLEFNSLNAK